MNLIINNTFFLFHNFVGAKVERAEYVKRVRVKHIFISLSGYLTE